MIVDAELLGGEEILNSLKPYQREIVQQLVAQHGEEEAAKIWLSSSGPLDLRKFGGVPSGGGDAFYQRFYGEFRALICGDERYKTEREKFLGMAKPTANQVVIYISVALGSTLGVAVGLLTPAVALLLKVVVKIGVNAWCAC